MKKCKNIKTYKNSTISILNNQFQEFTFKIGRDSYKFLRSYYKGKQIFSCYITFIDNYNVLDINIIFNYTIDLKIFKINKFKLVIFDKHS